MAISFTKVGPSASEPLSVRHRDKIARGVTHDWPLSDRRHKILLPSSRSPSRCEHVIVMIFDGAIKTAILANLEIGAFLQPCGTQQHASCGNKKIVKLIRDHFSRFDIFFCGNARVKSMRFIFGEHDTIPASLLSR